MTPLRLLLADDSQPLRQSLAAHLAGRGFTLAGEASNGSQAWDLARSLQPDVLLMDYRMPEMDGATTTARILETNSGIAIFLTSLSFERQYVLRAFVAGARGYVAKDDVLASLEAVAEAARTRRSYVSPSVAALIERTAPPSVQQTEQQVLTDFDREAPALAACARRLAGSLAADAVLTTAFRAYWIALRESETIADPQTWLLLSLAALLFPAEAAAPKRWSFGRSHPPDRELRQDTPRLREHVSACRACYLAWTLASHDPHATADVAGPRATLLHDLATRDEPQLFVAFAARQAAVMRLAASELQVMLGSQAGKGWMQREASAGSWLGVFLGGKPQAEASRG
jgi:DNA-binding NarL/FixJ family response regulator